MAEQLPEPGSLLLVQDDLMQGRLLKEYFENKGLPVRLRSNGKEGYETFLNNRFQLCILDIALQGFDGFELAKEIRLANPHIPIIFLSSRNTHEEKLHAFELGCDDYVSKPFNPAELFLRVRAILKRCGNFPEGLQPSVFRLGSFEFDYNSRILKISGEHRRLSSKECELLKLFCNNINTLLPRNLILKRVWGTDNYFASKSMDVYLSKLRKLLREDPRVEIQNLHGSGFKLILHPGPDPMRSGKAFYPGEMIL